MMIFFIASKNMEKFKFILFQILIKILLKYKTTLISVLTHKYPISYIISKEINIVTTLNTAKELISSN